MVIVAAPALARADGLLVQGSSTFNSRLMVPHRAAIEAESGHQLAVIANKSSHGLIALFERRAHLAMISTSLESEVAHLRKTNPNFPFEQLRGFLITRTRIALAVNPSNPVRSADVKAIRGVLLGEIDNWRALGGPDLPIQVVVVSGGGGVKLSIESALLGGKRIAPRNPVYVRFGSELVKVVEQEPAALGLAQLGAMQERKLPELVTGVEIEQQLNLVSLGEPSASMRSVIAAARRVAVAAGMEDIDP